MHELTNITQHSQPTMSSREIATLCDKRHSDVKRDIDVMAEQLEIDVRKFAHIYLYPWADQTNTCYCRDIENLNATYEKRGSP